MKKQKDSKAKVQDEWGDEGKWVTIADFTKIKKGGIPAKELLRLLKTERRRAPMSA